MGRQQTLTAVLMAHVLAVASPSLAATALAPAAAGTVHVGRAGVSITPNLSVSLRDQEQSILEFDIGGIPETVPFSTLGLAYCCLQGSGALDLYSYTGDGAITLDDYYSGNPVEMIALGQGMDAAGADVTSVLQAAVDSHVRYLGFRIAARTDLRIDLGGLFVERPALTIGGYTRFAPIISEVRPGRAISGKGGMALEVLSSNYFSTAICRWDGMDLVTNSLNFGSVYCWVPAGGVAAPGIHKVTLFNPGPYGGESEPYLFKVRDPATFHVDDNAPADPGPGDPNVSDPAEDGSAEHPFDRVQEALDQSLGPDVIRIMPGVYQEDLLLPQEGATIVGGGREVTTLRAKSSTALWGSAWVYDPDWPILSLSDLTVEGGLQLFDWSYSEKGASEVEIRNVAFRSAAVWLGSGYWTHAAIENVSLIGSEIDFYGSTAGAIVADVSGLDAPASGISLDASGTEGYVWVDLADSVVSYAGTYIYYNAIGAGLTARNVRFTGPGITASTSGSCFFSVEVMNSTFAQGGIEVQGRGGGSDICFNTWFGVRAANSEFRHDGIRFAGTYGVPRYWRSPYADSFILDASSNRFAGSGIQASVDRGEDIGESWGYTSAMRIDNNVFDSAPVGFGVHYGYPIGWPEPITGHTASLLEVVNNTFSRNSVGVEVVTGDHEVGLDSYETYLTNNIIAGGVTGLSVVGTQDQQLMVVGNDLHGNSEGNYADGLPDQTGVNGNISVDPLFTGAVRGDLSLQPGSRCIDAGASAPEVPADDITGTPRPLDGNGDGVAMPDMGAFEFNWIDADHDGHPVGEDCDDNTPTAHPGAVDLPGNFENEDCSGAPACDPTASWRNHGEFVRCVSRECNRLVAADLVPRMQCSALLNQATQSNVGNPRRDRRPKPPQQP